MLRCPPSRVNLTSSDLTDFDHRYFARQQARSAQAQGTNVRLSPGPSRLTSFALVPEQHNEGRKRAASTLSQATICSTENGTLAFMPGASSNDASAIWTATTPSNIPSRTSDQSGLCVEAANALANTLYQQSPSQQPPRTVAGWRAAPVPETLPLQHDEQRFHDQHAQPGPTDLDGSADVRLPSTPSASHEDTGGFLSRSYAQRHVVGITPKHQDPAATPHRTMPSLLSSARARRRHARSHDIIIPEYEQSVHDAIQSRHLERVPSGAFVPGLPQPVPELILPPYDEPTVYGMTLPLDPGAAVFVPRTRFGTTTGSDFSMSGGLGPRWSSLDTAHSTSDLRIRSSSEQNAEQPVRHPLTPARISSSPLPSTPPVRRIISEASTPRSPLKDISPSKVCRTPRSAITRKPLPSHAMAATPRVRVYDDSVPAHMQPQTPADIGTSARRARGLSEAAVQGPTALANAVALTSSPPIPQRRSHRHTYPSTTPRPQVSHSLPGITPAGPSTASAQGPSRPPQARRRADARTHSSEENEIESQMGLLEEDRCIWERRQEAGSLESTPPGEGRFERFL
ncbi:hypothetical protein LTR48_001637 [Friedmanniomyces endolithicus]|uniref:Uncharacterized protein n=1 Tax=Rachicladosporium monterosium TaxID=1507873 RepID=A0ABR0L373_9PEZI|nr:hypothetical protein LTR48_001637 [Friedmanniomyces endolithicus]KAK5142778.1 hypothetical protein LTR32_004951 [Rachicladosporium monterosium]